MEDFNEFLIEESLEKGLFRDRVLFIGGETSERLKNRLFEGFIKKFEHWKGKDSANELAKDLDFYCKYT